MTNDKNPDKHFQVPLGDDPLGEPMPEGLEGLEELIGPEQMREVISALQEEVDKKSAELASKQDQYVRAMAEMENMRRRMEREKEETSRYAISKFAKDVLSVGDNFQRTIAAVPAEAVSSDPALKTLLEGVSLAERDYRAVLERHGVRAIESTGKPFNPHVHQAVMEQENVTVPSGTVLQVFQPGYMLDDRCLRPAMVVVSRGGPKAARGGDPSGAASDAGSDTDANPDETG